MGLVEELRYFRATTSLKGVPRIFRATSWSLKTLWTLAVLGFLFVSAYQSYKLIREFVSYPKVTSITEKLLNLTGEDNGIELPDLMLCNLNPFSSESMKASKAPTVKQYHDVVLQITTCKNCSKEEQEGLDQLRAGLLTPFGYYQFLGSANISSIGHRRDEFIVSCSVIILDGIFYSTAPCEGRVNISAYLSKNYYNCYNLHMLQSDRVMGIAVSLYLDNFDLDFAEYFNIFSDIGQNLGALVLVYEPGTVPLLSKDGIAIAPGTYTDIKYNIEKRNRLKGPHGTCIDNLNIKNLNKFEFDNEKATMESCSSFCVEQQVAYNCSCVDAMSLGIIESQGLGLPFCGSAHLEVSDLISKLSCAKAVRNTVLAECIDSCPLRCTQMYYPTKVSQSAWPQRPLQETFYNTYIMNRTFEKRFEDLFVNNSLHYSYEQYQHESAVIKENFLKVAFYLADNKYMNLEDSPKVHSSNLISQLGGTLNLWSGITMCLLVEIIEFIIRLAFPRTGSTVETGIDGNIPGTKARLDNLKAISNGPL